MEGRNSGIACRGLYGQMPIVGVERAIKSPCNYQERESNRVSKAKDFVFFKFGAKVRKKNETAKFWGLEL